jgi:hypothetical protein
MKRKRTSVRAEKKFFKNLAGSNYLPYVLCFTAIGIFFVLIRMKGIEQHYKYSEISKKIENANFDNKELKAKKARSLSVKNLRKIARRNNLKQPSQKQIIVVP